MLHGTGYIPRGPETQIYSIADSDLSLVATAEITLGGLLSDEILDAEPAADQALRHQPLLSHRGRAPAAGHRAGCTACISSPRSRCSPSRLPEQSDAMLDYFCELECRIFDGLGLAYRVVDTATGDLGGPAYRKFDLEAWMPGRGDGGRIWRSDQHFELHRLSGPAAGHSLSRQGRERDRTSSTRSTARRSPISRAMIAMLENYQQADGSIVVPDALRSWVGKDRIVVPRP